MSDSVLVSGSGGFIGSKLVEILLMRGFQVVALARRGHPWRLRTVAEHPNLILVQADLTDQRSLRETLAHIDVDVIVHLAAEGVHHTERDALSILQANVRMVIALMTLAVERCVARFVNTGSGYEYASARQPIDENVTVKPLSTYALSKAVTTLTAHTLARHRHVPLCTLRLFPVFGEREARDKLIPQMITAALRRTPLALRSGCQVRDYVYIEDAVQPYVILANRERPFPDQEIINVGTGEGITLRKLGTLLSEIVPGAESCYLWGALPDREDEPRYLVADISKARRAIGWAPLYSIKDGLRHTVLWHRQQLEAERHVK